MKIRTFELVFDNGGSLTLQSRRYVHAYDSMAQAARDVLAILAGVDASDWEGHDPAARRDWTPEDIRNGGYRVYDADDVREIKAGKREPGNAGWYNCSQFFLSLCA